MLCIYKNKNFTKGISKAMNWTPELVATIPDDLLTSEWKRRIARKRKSYSGGMFWKKHNATAANCRCVACMKKRQEGSYES